MTSANMSYFLGRLNLAVDEQGVKGSKGVVIGLVTMLHMVVGR